MTRPLDFGLCSADNLKIIYSPQDQPKGLVRGSGFLGRPLFLLGRLLSGRYSVLPMDLLGVYVLLPDAEQH